MRNLKVVILQHIMVKQKTIKFLMKIYPNPRKE